MTAMDGHVHSIGRLYVNIVCIYFFNKYEVFFPSSTEGTRERQVHGEGRLLCAKPQLRSGREEGPMFNTKLISI